jgi:drug/metabolite transporter (DMT)-like permease
MVASSLVFAGSSAASKWLVDTYPVGEVLFSRAAVSLLSVGVFIIATSGWVVFRTRRYGAHVIRSVSQTTSQTLLLVAFSLMPLASATAINFSAPLFATLASLYFLKEPVGAARWVALVGGFFGILIITGPGTDTFQAGALFALGNAMLFGTFTAGVRGMTKTESAETLTIYQLIFLTVFFGLSLPIAFVMPTWADAGLMLANGLANGVGQYWWTRALHLAPTSAVAPYQYLSMVWALILGFAIWGDAPTVGLLIGAAIVIASGLFLLWRETRRVIAPAETA